MDYFAVKCIVLGGLLKKMDTLHIFRNLTDIYPGVIIHNKQIFINPQRDLFYELASDKYLKIPESMQPAGMTLNLNGISIYYSTMGLSGVFEKKPDGYYFKGNIYIQAPPRQRRVKLYTPEGTDFTIVEADDYIIMKKGGTDGQNIS